MGKKIEEIRDRIRRFRSDREMAKELAAEVVEVVQPEIIAVMQKVDPGNVGIIVDPSDQSKGTAFVQQNEATDYWDDEAIQDYIKNRPKLKKACMTEIFDLRKWEAEVAAGNVSPKIARKFKKKGTTPKPFIRFGKATKNSM